MINLPIKNELFKKSFLGGAGNLVVGSDANEWTDLFNNDLSFRRDVTRVAQISLDISEDQNLKLGRQGVLALQVSGGMSAIHRIELFWPGDTDAVLKQYGLQPFLADGKLYIHLLLSGEVEAALSGQYQGPLTATFGLKAGGSAAFERFRLWDATTGARKILVDLFREARFPQQIVKPSLIPSEGEVLVTKRTGYLGLSAALTWGYSVAGSKSLEVNKLALDLDYALKLAASLSVSYRLAGDFEVIARRGKDKGWVNFVVRKRRESEFNFAADLGLEADLQLNGLPESADDFLAKITGASGERILQTLNRARKLSSLDALQKEVDRIAKTTVGKLADKWLGAALDKQNVQRFFQIVGEVVNQYGDCPESS